MSASPASPLCATRHSPPSAVTESFHRSCARGVVVDDQHAAAVARRRRGRRGGLNGRGDLRHRHSQGEGAAPAGTVAVRVDRSAVHFDQTSSERQPDTQAGLGMLCRRVVLREQVEDAGQHLVGDADPRVRDAKDDLALVSGRRRQFGGDADVSARIGELDGVVQHVGDDLHEPVRVGLDQHSRIGHVDA